MTEQAATLSHVSNLFHTVPQVSLLAEGLRGTAGARVVSPLPLRRISGYWRQRLMLLPATAATAAAAAATSAHTQNGAPATLCILP